ncbi:M48 family metallopeptidase [Dysgonomonas sp. ZJ709]|uniref:tetratricopeptide repeat protein n=1 Tax=Dysgonomonas sp. ZJ709 TaxID=2709797 RepID=UPI0013EAC2C4|nr:tetratricopeptide repeat protein [Dysgonomonas sp. ZJ709]
MKKYLQSLSIFFIKHKQNITIFLLTVTIGCMILWIWMYWQPTPDDNSNAPLISSFIGTLGAGVIAYLVARWQIKESSEIQRESNRKELLLNYRRKFVEEFYIHYIFIKNEMVKPIIIQREKLALIKEFIDKKTILGKPLTMPDLIKRLEDDRRDISLIPIDLINIQKSGVALSSLIECNRELISKDMIQDHLQYTNDLTFYNNLFKTWSDLREYIIANNKIENTEDLILQHENEINELNKKIEYHDWKLVNIVRPLQKIVFNELFYGDEISKAEQLFNQAIEWFLLKRYDKSLELAKKSLQYKSSSRIHRFIGQIYFAQEEYEKALKFLKKSLSINPNNPPTLDCIAETYIKMENYSEAFRNYEERLALDCDAYVALQNMVEMLIMDNKTNDAKNYLALSERITVENIFANKFLKILLSIIDGHNRDLPSDIKELKNTKDWGYSKWSYTEISIWIRSSSKTKHLTDAQKKYIRDLITALE